MRAVDRSTLVDKVVKIILDSIRSKTLAAGQKLSTEAELAQELGVARTTVREAIKVLIGMGVLHKEHDGVFVTNQLSLLITPGIIPRVLVTGKVEELFEARKVIECELAALAASRASRDDIVHLKELNETIRREITKTHLYKDLDIQFHRQVATAAHNPVLCAMYDVTSMLLELFDLDKVNIDAIKIITPERHERLIQAIERRDPMAAKECAREGLEIVEEHLLSQMRRPGASAVSSGGLS